MQTLLGLSLDFELPEELNIDLGLGPDLQLTTEVFMILLLTTLLLLAGSISFRNNPHRMALFSLVLAVITLYYWYETDSLILLITTISFVIYAVLSKEKHELEIF